MGDSISQILAKLTPVQKGMNLRKALTAERIQALQDAIFALSKGENIVSGANIRRKCGSGWVMLSANASRASAASGGTTIQPYPFDVTVGKDESGEPVVTVRAGTVNSLMPTNMFEQFPTFGTATSETIEYAKVIVSTDGKKVTSSEIQFGDYPAEAQVPTPNGLPTSVEVVFAVVYKGTAIRTIGNGSINLSGAEQFRLDKNPPAQAGQLAYVPYYRWNQTVS